MPGDFCAEGHRFWEVLVLQPDPDATRASLGAETPMAARPKRPGAWAGFCGGTTPFTIELAVPTTTLGDGTLTLSAFGDFNIFNEAFTVVSEGLSFGIFLDSDTGNDAFSGVAGDIGNDYRRTLVGTASFAAADLAPRIADGVLSVSFTPTTPLINDFTFFFETEEFISAQIEFETGVVPLPAPALLLLSGLASLTLLRRRA
ncbi:MAG: hypothetical protein ACFBRM_14505 [Pikeienuella sp.]